MDRPTGAPGWAGALSGVVAAAAGVAAGELVAGVDARLRGPIAAVGDRVVDVVPSGVRSWAIDTFGTSDKTVLLAGVTTLLVIAAALIGIVAVRRSIAVGLVGVGAFTLVGVVASLGRGGTGWARPVPPIVAGVVAAWVLVVLVRRVHEAWPPNGPAVSGDRMAPAAMASATSIPASPGTTPTPATAGGGPVSASSSASPASPAAVPTTATPSTADGDTVSPPVPGIGAADRRRFLQLGAGIAGAAVVAGGVGRWMQSRSVAVIERLKVVLPKPARPLPAVPATAHARGAVPFFTPNDDFYRIDTALVVPRVSTDGWTLEVSGRVRKRITLSYAELLDRPMVEADITISCVSNEVGGDLIGTARWLGCRLDDLLDEAGIDPTADQVVGRSVDGFTTGFPTTLLDGRPALVAVGMNGEPLPIDHGYPARLVVPGVYGYVSATKWLRQIELTRFDEFDAYWIPRGWSRLGPIKTQSRIDTPRQGTALAAGEPATIAGVAWAMDRRISRVEVRVESDGGWREATLADGVNDTTWRQWRMAWTPTKGEHTITVRATDGDGVTQPEERSPVAPDGATGWHTIRVRAT